MGIPRLRQHLEPYTKQVELKDRRVVIDGPGLAYHVFSLCHARALSGSLFDQPTYTTLGDTAIKWLDDLTNSGADLSALYFDGYLPASKEPERKRRLVDLSTALRTYHSLYPSGVPEGAQNGKKTITSATSRTNRKAPAPPFLVPAVLEALRTSEKYKNLIKLVPGEADSFCARDIQAGGGVVITSDTDLLVHDLGAEGSVAFFNDVEHKKVGGKATIQISEYSVWRICQRLSMPQEKGILSLAFELSMNSHLTLNQAIQRAQEGASRAVLSKQDYTDFIEQYLTPEIAGCGDIKLGPHDSLDPRVSELVLQVLSVSPRDLPSWASGAAARDDLGISMYLPVLVDSPSRTSAWEVSTSIRELAYGVPQLLSKSSVSVVAEFRRIQQPTSTGTQVEVPSPATLGKVCADLVSRIDHVRACVSEPELQWVSLAVLEDILVSQEQGKGSVLSLDVLHAEATGNLYMTPWDFMQLFAQVQGLYYSIRTIKQICEFVGRRQELPPDLVKLQQAIDDFPPLAGFPSIKTFSELLPQVRTRLDLKKLVTGLEVSGEITAKIDLIINPKMKSKNKRKRPDKDAGQNTAARPSPQSRNMFDLLGSD